MLKRRLARRFPRGRDAPADPRPAGRTHEGAGDGARPLGRLGLALDVGENGRRVEEGGLGVDGGRQNGRQIGGGVLREEVRD